VPDHRARLIDTLKAGRFSRAATVAAAHGETPMRATNINAG
jgi:hypothetical protein